MTPAPGRTVGRRSRVPAPIAAALLGVTAAALVTVALLAGRAGPWVATPPTGPAPTLVPPTVTRPALSGLGTLPKDQLPPQPLSAAWLIVTGLILGGALLVVLIVWLIRVLRRPGRPFGGIPATNALRSGVALAPGGEPEDALEDTDARTFDPRVSANAIIATWASLETAAATAGSPRRPASTPTEFLTALEERYPPPPGEEPADRTLLRLYHRARFDTSALAPGAAVQAAEAAAAIRRRFPQDQGHPEDPR